MGGHLRKFPFPPQLGCKFNAPMTSSPTAPQQKPELRQMPAPTDNPVAELSSSRGVMEQPPLPARYSRWPIGLGVVVVILTIAGLYWQSTYVSGIELNSLTWEQRGFSLRRDPFTGFQLTAVQHNPRLRHNWWASSANPHAQTLPLAISQHLNKTSDQPVRWDLVRLEHSELPGGGASILVELLKAEDRHYTPFWPQWSLDHPRRAAVLWPAAQRLVDFHKYEQLPALLNLALLENSLAEFEHSIGQLVQTDSPESFAPHLK